MEDNCIMLLSYVEDVGEQETTIRELARKCGVPKSSLYIILKDAFEDKTHSTLFRIAIKYGYDFKVYKTWNYCLNSTLKWKIISVVKWDWVRYKYND